MKIELHNLLTISLWEDEYSSLILRGRSLIIVNEDGGHKSIKFPFAIKELFKNVNLTNSQPKEIHQESKPMASLSTPNRNQLSVPNKALNSKEVLTRTIMGKNKLESIDLSQQKTSVSKMTAHLDSLEKLQTKAEDLLKFYRDLQESPKVYKPNSQTSTISSLKLEGKTDPNLNFNSSRNLNLSKTSLTDTPSKSTRASVSSIMNYDSMQGDLSKLQATLQDYSNNIENYIMGNHKTKEEKIKLAKTNINDPIHVKGAEKNKLFTTKTFIPPEDLFKPINSKTTKPSENLFRPTTPKS